MCRCISLAPLLSVGDPAVAQEMPPVSRSSRLAVYVITTALLSACKPKATCEPGEYRVQVVLHPGEPLNPDDDGQSLPTTVFLVQLSDEEGVERVRLDELRADPKAAFGDSYVAHEELYVYQGRDDLRTLKLKSETRVLMLAAQYRQVLGSAWAAIYDVPSQADHEGAVCTAVKRRQPPIADPCFYVMLERYETRGGATPPAGLKKDQVRVRGKAVLCAPPPHQYIIDPKVARETDKRRRLDPSKLPTRLPGAPRAPAPTPPAPPRPI